MIRAPKVKVSLTLSRDLLAQIDRDARRDGSTRSGVIEQWLRASSTRSVERELDEATAAYYASLRQDERAETEAIARASSASARRVRYDDQPRVRRGR